jgi:hypothetical protein
MGSRAGILPELVTFHDEYEQQTRQRLGEPAFQSAFSQGERLPSTRRPPSLSTNRARVGRLPRRALRHP